MTRKIILLAVFFLVIMSFACTAQNDTRWPYYSQFVDIDLEIGSGITVIKTSENSVLDLAVANVSFVPQDDERQKVLDFVSLPEPTTLADYAEYIWHHPTSTELDFTINARMRAYNTYTKIPKKVNFPIVTLPFDIIPYTKPTSNINSDDEDIHSIASELAEGEDDMYVVVYNIAQWTKQNIQYNLSTITADVSQPASWVLENRYGVCDELTSLFIAMLRSVGIPARFISGMAYTDLPDFEDPWGAHGWAEVYFPGHGWTEWDITYGEYGFVDPTHFKLKASVDSDESATVYIWQGRGVDATAKSMRLQGTLVNRFGQIPPRVKIDASLMYNSVGIGSYNLVEAEVENLENSYISTTVYLAPTENINVISTTPQIIYLRPKETKKIFWIIKVDADLDTDYIYTFPITVISLRNVTSRTSFVSMDKESLFSKEKLQKIVDMYEKESSSKTEAKLSMICEADKEYYYGYETPRITCAVKNAGNTRLSGLNICMETQCKQANLKINQEKVFEYTLETLNHGKNQLILSAGNDDLTKLFLFDIFVLENPKIEINQLQAPKNVSYRGNFTIEFLLEKRSSSNPLNVTVAFTNGGLDEEWFIEDMENNQRYIIDLKGSNLKRGNNTFNINATFYDMNGIAYSVAETFQIELAGVSLWERFLLSLRDIEQGLRKLFK